MAKMLTVDGDAIVTVLEADGGARALVPVDIPPAGGPTIVARSAAPLDVPAFGTVLAPGGPFVAPAGLVLACAVLPVSLALGQVCAPGFGAWELQFGFVGTGTGPVDLRCGNTTGAIIPVNWVVFAL